MKSVTTPTEIELDALLSATPIPGKLSRRDIIAKLQKHLKRLQDETKELAAELKSAGADSPGSGKIIETIQTLSETQVSVETRIKRLKNPQTGITSITIENFKGIGLAVTIPLRPITLLFGANSAGKSTILQALHYTRELLERNNANPDRTLTGGEAIEMGGFRNLVHRHNLEKEIRVMLEITPTADGVPTWRELAGEEEVYVRAPVEQVQGLLESLESGSVGLESNRRHQDALKAQLQRLWAETNKRSGVANSKFRDLLRKTADKYLVQVIDAMSSDSQRSWKDFSDFLYKCLSSSENQEVVHLNSQEFRSRLQAMVTKVEAQRLVIADLENSWQSFVQEISTLEHSLSTEDEQKIDEFDHQFQRLVQEALASTFRSSTGSELGRIREFLANFINTSQALNINPHAETVGIEMTARWDFEKQEGWFSECQFLVNAQPIVTIRKSKPDSRPTIERIDYFHPALLAMDDALKEQKTHYEEELAEYMAELHGDLNHRLLRKNGPSELQFDVICQSTGQILIEKGKPLSRELLKRLVGVLPDIACLPGADELFPQARIEIEEAIKRFQERQAHLQKRLEFNPLIQLAGRTSVAPDPSKALPFKAAELGEDRGHFADLINQIAVGITSLALQSLNQLRYIGPIRAIPDRSHEAPQIEEPSRWSSGLAAWDLLLRHYNREQGKGDEFVDSVAQWLQDPQLLDLGYRVEVTGLRPIADDSLLMSQLRMLQSQYDEKNQHEFRQAVWGPLQTLPQTPRIRIVDTRTNTEVGPKDIGIGVAQALPIVVGSLDPKSKFMAVEQPELHLHPAAQARLGDLFVTQAKAERLFLIETHSETLMLRIFRRIRETSRNKAPRKELQLSKDDVALLFLSSSEKGTSVSEIRLNDQGKFIDPVPGGFFEEGFDELF